MAQWLRRWASYRKVAGSRRMKGGEIFDVVSSNVSFFLINSTSIFYRTKIISIIARYTCTLSKSEIEEGKKFDFCGPGIRTHEFQTKVQEN